MAVVEQKIQSLQHSILFLQEQHALTLSGLHEEIKKLQKKCSDLTFQVSLNQSSPSNVLTTSDDNNSLKDQLEDEIRNLRKENSENKKTVDTKDKRIKLLEGQLKSKEQKYSDDLKNVQRVVAELQLELDNKSSSMVYLTTQLRKKNKLSGVKSEYLKEDGEQVDGRHSYSPSPPRAGTPSKRHNLRRRTVTSPAAANMAGFIAEGSSHQLVASDYVLENSLPKTNSSRFSSRYKQSIIDPPRPAIGHSQTKRERDLRLHNREKPSDYEDFIRIHESNEIIAKPVIEPLPPITTRSGRQLQDNMKANRKSRLLRSKAATASSTGGVETLIVEKSLTSPDRKYMGELQNSTMK